MMNLKTVVAVLAVGTLAVACGGLEKTTIASNPLMYSKLTTFTVMGPNLDKGITLVAPNCSGIKEVEGATANQRSYTCTPAKTGVMTISVIGGGTTLHSITATVPTPQVAMKTSMGDIVMELDPNSASLTVNNFLQYVAADFYSKLIFHRVMPNFMIQAGGYDSALIAATTRTAIKLEVPNGLSNLRGTVAMARTALADSATSQFFINSVDNVDLDTNGGGYAVFGKVISGMETVDAISAVTTATVNTMANVPVVAVVINAMTQTQ